MPAASVTVNFNVVAGAQAGVEADWYVLCQGPKGWTSLKSVTVTTATKPKSKTKNGKTTTTSTTTNEWVKGTVPWKTQVAIEDIAEQNVLSVTLPSKTLPVGAYTFWVGIVPNGGKQDFVSVPLIVTP